MPRISDMRNGMRDGPEPARTAAAPMSGNVAGVEGYALRALSEETLKVAMAVEGTRNDSLNGAAFNLAQLVAGGALPGGLVVAELTQAARAAGLDDAEIRQTLGSALPAGAALPRTPPPQPGTEWLDALPADVAPAQTMGLQVTGSPETAEQVDPATVAQQNVFNRDVAMELHREHVKEMTRRMLRAERDDGRNKPRLVDLPTFLAEPDEDVEYRINELWPTGGRIIFAAQYKSGKSTAVGNVLRSLADGTALFDRFDTAPAHRIVLLDNELDERTLRRWLRDQGIRHPESVQLVPLRGKVSSFDILDDEVRAQWAAVIKGADVVILDCLRPVLDSLGLSEDKDAGRFLVAFDALLDGAGVGEALIVHHMGHSGERSRGDSRILDWPTATWRIIRANSDDTSSPRYFSAFGRDVEISESRIEYDPTNRHLVLVGGSRMATKTEGALDLIVALLQQQTVPMAARRIETDEAVMGHGFGARVIRQALKDGAITGRLIQSYSGWEVVRHGE